MTPEEFQATLERNAQANAEAQERRDAAAAENKRLLEARTNGRVFDPREQPTLFSLNLEKRAQEAAESARIAAITPRQIWISTLSYQEQQRIAKWEAANKGLKFPMPVGMEQQILASKGI